jgi:hypothetical protein
MEHAVLLKFTDCGLAGEPPAKLQSSLCTHTFLPRINTSAPAVISPFPQPLVVVVAQGATGKKIVHAGDRALYVTNIILVMVAVSLSKMGRVVADRETLQVGTTTQPQQFQVAAANPVDTVKVLQVGTGFLSL